MKSFTNPRDFISSPIRYSTFHFLSLLRYSIFNIRYSTFPFLSPPRPFALSLLRPFSPSPFLSFIFCLLLALASPSLSAQQQWTEPLNISNLGGYSKDPDMVIDHNGVIHVVWSYCITQTHWLIMYNHSEDDGLTWTEPLDLLQNTDLWMSQPHIACDSKNNLYVTYTYNTMDYNNMLIKMLTYDGHQWGEPIIISEGMPGSHYNKVVVDNIDKLYVFWAYCSQFMYYRYFENSAWSDFYCPYYDSTDIFAFADAHAINDNIMLWVGASMSANYYGERPQYYEYRISANQWENPEMISNDTIVVDIDLALNNAENPESAYRKKSTISVGVTTDSTMHVKKEGNFWGTPDLVAGTAGTQKYQQIAIDQNNAVHVVEQNKTTEGYGLLHYKKKGEMWLGQYIDSCYIVNFPKLLFHNNQLNCVYSKTWVIEKEFYADLFFTKYDIITDLKEVTNTSHELKIYPNPSHGNVHIEFENNKQQHIDLSVFDMNGKQIVTLINGIKPPGVYRQLWKVTGKNRKENAPHLYLVRLQSGRNTTTQTVEIIR